ncbi:MAG TPA: trypsin-like serine protease [Allosphingosinicella sp.]|jgi:hypothetical protein
MKTCSWMLAAIAASLSVPVPAIVIRHDVPDRQYRAREASFPAVFALYVNRAGHKDCVATLIAPQWAVTAAHCTRDAPFTQAMAQARPRHRVEIAGRAAFVDRVVRHPASERREGGSFRHWVDLALVHLSRPVRDVTPLRLHRADDEQGLTVWLPGWGTTGTGMAGLAAPDGRFRLAQNRVSGVQGGWLFWRFDDPSSGAALPLEGVSGPGDSGGPALVRRGGRYEILGISSSQQSGGRPEGTYGVIEGYVRVSQFAAWINEVARR